MNEYPVFYGRPKIGSRTSIEETCYDLLDKLDIDYLRVEHKALFTMESLAPVEQALGCPVAKNLFLSNRQQTKFYLLLIPSNKSFKTRIVSEQIGCSRLSFCTEQQLLAYIGTPPGSASVLGLLNDKTNKVQLIADKELKSQPWFACHPCLNTTTLRFSTSDLLNKLLPALSYSITWVDLSSAL